MPSRTRRRLRRCRFSTRFGTQDKRCAQYAGTTLLNASLNNLLPAFKTADGDYQLAVVVRPEDSVASLAIPPQCTIIRAANACDGLSSSISDAVTFISQQPRWQHIQTLALMLGDMPALQTETVNKLAQYAHQNRIIRPAFRQQPGHPVFFGRRFWPELMTLSETTSDPGQNYGGQRSDATGATSVGDTGARKVIKQHASEFSLIPVEDEGVIFDIDTPQQIIPTD